MKNLLSYIVKYSEDFRKNFLEKNLNKKDFFLNDPIKALEFILSLSFYQGRKDQLSKVFESRTKEVLIPYLKEDNILLKKGILIKKIKENSLYGENKEYNKINNLLKNNNVKKEADRIMVLSIINFIQSCEEKNIVNHLKQKIEIKQTSIAYKELTGIFSIGPKISSLILRDIVCIYELENKLREEDYSYLFPVDTWIHHISKKIGIISSEKIYKNESKDIVKKCFEYNIDPIKLNQGMWYIGKHSLDIVLKDMSKKLLKN